MCGVRLYVFLLRKLGCVPVYGMPMHASIVVCLAVKLLLDNVQDALGLHASERHPQIQGVCGKAGFKWLVQMVALRGALWGECRP